MYDVSSTVCKKMHNFSVGVSQNVWLGLLSWKHYWKEISRDLARSAFLVSGWVLSLEVVYWLASAKQGHFLLVQIPDFGVMYGIVALRTIHRIGLLRRTSCILTKFGNYTRLFWDFPNTPKRKRKEDIKKDMHKIDRFGPQKFFWVASQSLVCPPYPCCMSMGLWLPPGSWDMSKSGDKCLQCRRQILRVPIRLESSLHSMSKHTKS